MLNKENKPVKILAVVVTYYPEKELLEKNITSFINEVEKILIWENTPEEFKFDYRFIDHEKVNYCGDGINSISHALNYAWNYAKKNGFEYLLTMDQDSQWVNFRSYLQHTIYNPDSPSGIWGPNASYGGVIPAQIVLKDRLITSGMLLYIELINQIEGWDELFAIDCVDDEFCLRAKRKGIKSYLFGMCTLLQRYGKPSRVSLLGRTVELNNYSPRRLYSIYKSHVILLRLFPENELIRKEFRNHWIALIKWIVFFEDDGILKMFAIVRGLISGFFCKTGSKYMSGKSMR